MITDRYSGYRRWRDRKEMDVPWVRPEELSLVPFTGKVVLVNGAFDILHAGHMRLIHVARSQGAHLLCALDTDEKVRTSKGPERPYLSFAERAAALSYMPIDLIIPVTTTADMDLIIPYITLRVQSEEYASQPSRYTQTPKLLVRDSGTHSTTIAQRIKRGGPSGR